MTSVADRLRLRRLLERPSSDKETTPRRFTAKLGDGQGNVEVPGKHSTVYIRRGGRSRIQEALNVHVPKWDELPVIVGYEQENPDTLQVLRVDWGALKNGGNLAFVPSHHENHELLNPDGGGDVVWVRKTQVIPLAPFPTNPPSMQLWIQKDFYPWGASWKYWPGGLTADLSAYLPHAYSGVYVLVTIDGATNALQYTSGTEYPYWPPLAEEDAIPAAPSGSVPIAAVYLYSKQNLIPNSNFLLFASFEALGGAPPVFFNWTDVLGLGVLAADNVTKRTGARSCTITEGGGGRDTGCYQDFAVIEGHRYQIRFWNYGDGGANDGAYRVYDVTNGVDIIATTGTGHTAAAWQEVATSFVAPDGCATARLYFYCPAAGGSQTWFEDVTVTEVNTSLDWDSFRDMRLFNQPMPGSIAPAVDDWIGITASNEVVFQPDNVAVYFDATDTLVEYADPDDAFAVAGGFDVILVPPGQHFLSSCHATTASIVGMFGTQAGSSEPDCELYGHNAGGDTLISVTSGNVQNVSVNYIRDSGDATALEITDGGAFNVFASGYSKDADGIGIKADDSELYHCEGVGFSLNFVDSVGIWASDSVLWDCYGHASSEEATAVNVFGIYIDTASCILHYCKGEATDANGIRYGICADAVNAYLYHCYGSGADGDIAAINAAVVYVYSVQYDSSVGTVTQMSGDRAGIARDETITGTWTFEEEITQAEQAGDPGAPGAGYARLYPKDDAGQTKYYFQDDAGSVYEIQGIVEDLTVTVGGAGDFAAIQAAVNWLKNWIIKGDCVIDCDAAAYDEAVEFADLLICPGSTLTLEGDTRALVGISYVDGASMNQAAIANGGSGTCALATNAARDQITVTGTAGNPDFSTAGIVNSDRILVYADDGNSYERIVNTVDPGGAGTNIIEITVALPVGATLGNDATAICLLPDRSVERTAAGECVEVNTVRGIVLAGWYLQPSTGADCHGVYTHNHGAVTCENVAVEAEDYGFYALDQNSFLYAEDGACSAWNCERAFVAGGPLGGVAALDATYSVVINASVFGYYANNFSYIGADYTIGANCGQAYRANQFSEIYCNAATARQNTSGYVSYYSSLIQATNTNNNNNGNGADYSPLPGAFPGSNQGNHYAVIYASN